MEFNNVENIILQSIKDDDRGYPQLIPRYILCSSEEMLVPYHASYVPVHMPCCCSTIRMKEALNVTISGLMIGAAVNISGIIIEHSIDIHIQQNIISSNDNLVNDTYGVGIYIIDGSNQITIDSLETSNVLFGVLIWEANNVTIHNSSFKNCRYSGLYILETNHIKLQNLVSNHSGWHGVILSYTRYSLLENLNITLSGYSSLFLDNCADTTALKISSQDNNGAAVIVYFSTNTTIINVLSMNNKFVGVFVESSTNTAMTSISLVNDQGDGVAILDSTSTTLTNISSMNSHGDGIDVFCSTDTIMRNVASIDNQRDGISVAFSRNTTIINILSMNNHRDGVFVNYSTNTAMTNISSVNDERNGVFVLSSTNTTLTNISTMNSHGIGGIEVHDSTDTIMRNVTSIDNQHYGISVVLSYNTKMINISAINNKDLNINILNCINTEMINIQSSMNGSSGTLPKSSITLRLCSNIRIQSISVLVDKNIDYNAISLYVCTDILLEDSVFSGITSDLQQVTTNVVHLPAIIALHNTKLTLKNCKFTSNRITSILVTHSNITLDENILFESNSAISGAAFIFSRSVLIVSELSNVVFRNNSASQYGAAIYIVTEELPETSILLGDLIDSYSGISSFIDTTGTQCFIQVNATRSNTAHLTFINNTAVEGGDVVYGGFIAAGYDGDWNCLLSFKNISDMMDQSSVRQITSAPSRVCLCHDTSPDCLIVVDPTSHTIYPGETLTVSVAVVGQDFGTVSGYVYAQVVDTADTTYNNTIVPDRVRYDNGLYKNLNYTVYSSCEECEAVLVLTSEGRKVSQLMNVTDNQRLNQSWSILESQPDYHALALDYAKRLITVTNRNLFLSQEYDKIVNSVIDNLFTLTPQTLQYGDYNKNQLSYISNKLRFPTQIYTYPLYFNIQFHPCPLGFTLSQSNKCDCNQLLKHMPTVECVIDGETITRAGSVWVGVDDNETVAASQYCPLNYCKNESIQLTLKDNASNSPDSQCNYKHSGILCGGCQPDLSLTLGSEQCLHCSNAYITLILVLAVAGISLVVFIKVLDFTVCHGAINGLIFYANIISANKHLYYNQSDINPITLFISWFNLDLGIETCFYDGLTAYARTWLQFIFPIYIWCIAGVIIFLANHSKMVAAISGNNGVPVLATLFLLSYAKLFNTIISAISYTTLYTTQGERLVWTVDGNVDYLGPEHAPLFAIAVLVILFLWLPYTLILLFGKYLNKINCRLITRYLLKLKPFLDANYAPFNDQHQYWFGVILVVKAVILLSSATIPANGAHIVVFSVAIASCLLTFWGNMVFSDTKTMLFHIFFFVNLGILNITKMFIFDKMTDMTIASYVLIGLVLIHFLGVCLVKIIKLSSTKCGKHCICCKKEEIEDDWELYMEAVLERNNSESESDEEDKDSHSSAGSIESLPTYPLV